MQHIPIRLKFSICQRSIDIVSRMEEEHGLDGDWIQGGYMYPVYDDQREEALKGLLVKQKEMNLNIDWVSPERISELAPGNFHERFTRRYFFTGRWFIMPYETG